MRNKTQSEQEQKVFNTDFSRFAAALLYIAAVIVLLLMIFSVLAICRISSYAFRTYDSVEAIPYHRVGLLLGTSPMQAPGVPNGYFTARIKAAADLYHAHKIDYILASGDNRALSYNEPREMRRALEKEGVPDSRIVLDYAGIRTLDSVKRANAVFMLKDMTVISQGFHNERALFIADADGISADGFNASEPGGAFSYIKVRFREFFARIRCVLDVYLLDTGPHFYGEPVKIGNISLPVPRTNKPVKLTSKEKQISDSASVLAEERKAEEERQAELARKAAQERFNAQARQAAEAGDQAGNQAGYDADQQLSRGECDTSSDLSKADCQGLEQSEAVSDYAQDEAQREAASNAANSLNEGESTYIDPHSVRTDQQESRSQKKVPRRGITPHGDPWDYY